MALPRDIEEQLKAEVNQRSVDLIQEFRDHVTAVKKSVPGSDDRKVFEGWVIQKIAGLQVQLLRLVEQVSDRK